MGRHVGLNEEGVLLGVEAAGHVECEGLVGSLAQLGRYLSNGNCVKVNYAVECLVILGESGEILDCAEVVSYGKVSRGLYSRENDLFIAVHYINPFGLSIYSKIIQLNR